LSLIPGVTGAVARLSNAGFTCPVVTVQSRIGKGLFTLADFERWFALFAADLDCHGARIVGPYVCPHRFAEPCVCKKPSPMLYERAAADHELSLSGSFVIGDSPSDVRAARRIGAHGLLVRTGWAADPDVVAAASADASAVVSSLAEAADWILEAAR